MNIKLILLLIGGFILTALIGSLAVEGARIATGKYLGYESRYLHGVGMYDFHSEQIGQEAEILKQRGVSHEELRGTKEWKALWNKDRGNMAIIEAGGLLLVLILAVAGILLLKRGRTRNDVMKLRHWVGFFVSLIFVRYLVLYAMMIFTNSRYCQEFSVYGSMGFNSFLPIYIVEAAGILLAVWIVLQIPRKVRFQTVVAGIIGGFTGLVLWIKWLGSVFES